MTETPRKVYHKIDLRCLNNENNFLWYILYDIILIEFFKFLYYWIIYFIEMCTECTVPEDSIHNAKSIIV